MTRIEDSHAERQQSANEIIPDIVQGFTVILTQILYQESHDDHNNHHGDMSPAIAHQPIEQIQLYHQPEEPVRTWLDDLLRLLIDEVDHHGKLTDHPVGSIYHGPIIMPQDIYDDESNKTENHQSEQFQVVIPHKRHGSHRFLLGTLLILHYQSEPTDKQEDWHAIMPKEREDMDEEVLVERHQFLHHLLRTCPVKGILILLDSKPQEMTVVMEDDAQDGHTT